MSNIEWTDPRQRVATLSTGKDNQSEIEALMGLSGATNVLSAAARELGLVDKAFAFDVLATTIDTWADFPVTELAMRRIVKTLAELRAEMADLAEVAVTP